MTSSRQARRGLIPGALRAQEGSQRHLGPWRRWRSGQVLAMKPRSNGISSSRCGQRTGLGWGLWPGSYKATAHLGGGQGGPPREQVGWSHQCHCGHWRHCADAIRGQTRTKEGRIRLSQSHCRQRSTMAEYLSQLSQSGRPRSEKSFRCKSRTRG